MIMSNGVCMGRAEYSVSRWGPTPVVEFLQPPRLRNTLTLANTQ
jgi:hypothetical protein